MSFCKMQFVSIISFTVITISSAVFSNSLYAEELAKPAVSTEMSSEALSEDDIELNRLLQILDKHTEIATKTNLNADYVPGIVTVLYAEDLVARGFRTVAEALVLIPGYNVSTDGVGNPRLNIRGLNESLFSGNVKFLLNSISLNATGSGAADSVLRLPVQQLERLEVIRGAGSALHGQHAFAGVVNIVTRKTGNAVFVRTGSFDTHTVGGVFSWSAPEHDFEISVNATAWESDGADVKSGPDLLSNIGLGSISLAPGQASQNADHLAAGIFLKFKDFTFITQYLESGDGNGFGTAALPPQSDDIATRHDTWIAEARQKLEITPSLNATLKLGWRENDLTSRDQFLFPPGFPFPPPGFPEGQILSLDYDESEYNGGVGFTWTGWTDHKFLLEWSFAKTQIDDAFWETNFLPSTGVPLGNTQRFRGSENFIEVGNSRFLNSVIIQDEFQVNSQLTLTAGVHYDHYDDVGDQFSPRVAGVFRLTDQHIFKAQYSRAFRPPSLQDLYLKNNSVLLGNPKLDFATIDTFELGYIYKGNSTTARITGFYSELDDTIELVNGRSENTKGARLLGFELELEQQLLDDLKLDTNLSFTDTEDLETNEQIAGSVNCLANVGLFYEPFDDMVFNIQYRYVGERNRDPIDTRNDLDDYHTVSLTGNLINLGTKGLALRSGVKNLFNADVRDPASFGTYPEDFPLPGREWWVQLSYDYPSL